MDSAVISELSHGGGMGTSQLKGVVQTSTRLEHGGLMSLDTGSCHHSSSVFFFAFYDFSLAGTQLGTE